MCGQCVEAPRRRGAGGGLDRPKGHRAQRAPHGGNHRDLFDARMESDKMSAEGIGKELQYIREITVKAPDFALGLAEHARVLFCLGYWGHAPTVEVFPTVKHLVLQRSEEHT